MSGRWILGAIIVLVVVAAIFAFAGGALQSQSPGEPPPHAIDQDQ